MATTCEIDNPHVTKELYPREDETAPTWGANDAHMKSESPLRGKWSSPTWGKFVFYLGLSEFPPEGTPEFRPWEFQNPPVGEVMPHRGDEGLDKNGIRFSPSKTSEI